MSGYRIYIAGAYGRRASLLEGLCKPLIRKEHEVTSRWLWEDHSSAQGPADMRGYAIDDMRDVARADILVAFSEHPGRMDFPEKIENANRGGRHAEFGMALATGMDCHLIGPIEHVFHNLPQVMHHASIGSFLSRFEYGRIYIDSRRKSVDRVALADFQRRRTFL